MFFYKKLYSTYTLMFLTLFLTLFSHSLFAESSASNQHISFTKPWVRLLPPTVMNTAGYVTINNSSDQADKLLAVWSPTINSMSVHQTKQVDGLLKMLEAENATIPAKGQLVMQPGGYHIMLMGLGKPLVENDTILICFEFERAGIVHVNFPIIRK